MKKIIILISILWYSQAISADYYVSPNGSETWPDCTSVGSPCEASDTEEDFLSAVAGDVVHFAAGTYATEQPGDTTVPGWNPDNSGSEGNEITFICDTGPCTVTDGGQAPELGASNRSYIIWDGFSGTKAYWGSYVYLSNNSHHITIQNFDITGFTWNSYENNSLIGVGPASGGCNNCSINNNTLHDNHGGGGTNSCAIMFFSGDDNIVENNYMYDNDYGIFDKSGTNDNIHRFNFMYNNDKAGFRLGTTAGATDGLRVYQNVIITSDAGGRGIQMSPENAAQTDTAIYNNTMIQKSGSAHGLMAQSESIGITGLSIYNNIVYDGDWGSRVESQDTLTESDYNIYYSVSRYGVVSVNDNIATLSAFGTQLDSTFSLSGSEDNSSTSDPSFVDANGSDVEDFKLASYVSGPAIGTGKSGVNIGAYITGNEVIGLDDGESPPAEPVTSFEGMTLNGVSFE